MSRALLHTAWAEDLERVAGLVGAFHGEMGYTSDPGLVRDALGPLLAGSPHGVVFLAGPRVAPLGYAVVSFSWSIEFGGLDAWLDELYVRPQVRRRGIAGDMLGALGAEVRARGAKGLSLEVDREDAAAQKLYAKAGFTLRDRYTLMTQRLG